MIQQTLFACSPPSQSAGREAQNEGAPRRFDGQTYEPKRDRKRLSNQHDMIFELMKDGKWRTLNEIQIDLVLKGNKYSPESSISARLRDFRKERNGAHTVNRKHLGQGLFEYQLEVRR